MRVRKHFTNLVKYFSVFTLIFSFTYLNRLFADIGMLITPESMAQHKDVVDRYFSARRAWVTSNVGAYLFKYFDIRKPPSYSAMDSPERGYYSVLVWRPWSNAYGYVKHMPDPLLGCSVSNCKFEEHNDTWLSDADAVVVQLLGGLLPDVERHKQFQRWVFWTTESPKHTFNLAKFSNRPTFANLAGVFNWSMSYRSDSDVPIPFGRTIPLPYPKLNIITDEDLKDLVPFWDKKQTDVLAAIVMSNCKGFRIKFINQLRRFLSVDMYGRCSGTMDQTKTCPGHLGSDCPVISKYQFYIVIENSNCRQYISEKVFHHAYSKGAIPIIMGAPLEDCLKLLPPNSFLHMENFASIKHLAKEIYAVSDDVSRLLSYHAWRNNFEIVEEHGFLGTKSKALCRLCEALNYNDRSPKVYRRDDIRLYLDHAVTCYRNRDWS